MGIKAGTTFSISLIRGHIANDSMVEDIGEGDGWREVERAGGKKRIEIDVM